MLACPARVRARAPACESSACSRAYVLVCVRSRVPCHTMRACPVCVRALIPCPQTARKASKQADDWQNYRQMDGQGRLSLSAFSPCKRIKTYCVSLAEVEKLNRKFVGQLTFLAPLLCVSDGVQSLFCLSRISREATLPSHSFSRGHKHSPSSADISFLPSSPALRIRIALQQERAFVMSWLHRSEIISAFLFVIEGHERSQKEKAGA